LKKDEEAASAFKITLAEKMKELELPTGRKIKLWVYDEMRYGLHPLVRRVWSLKGVRVVTPVERRFEWGYQPSPVFVFEQLPALRTKRFEENHMPILIS
jgi:hypothetical protein